LGILDSNLNIPSLKVANRREYCPFRILQQKTNVDTPTVTPKPVKLIVQKAMEFQTQHVHVNGLIGSQEISRRIKGSPELRPDPRVRDAPQIGRRIDNRVLRKNYPSALELSCHLLTRNIEPRVEFLNSGLFSNARLRKALI